MGYNDLTGRRFGKLTAIKISKTKSSRGLRWVCECECGNTYEAVSRDLIRGHTKSCGCSKGKWLPPGEAAFRKVLRHYKYGAKKRGIVFNLSYETVKRLTSSNCHYCGSKPMTVSSEAGGDYIYNGIDRVDNSAGYIESNCVPCCKFCNLGKRDSSYTEFKAWISRLVEHELGKKKTSQFPS